MSETLIEGLPGGPYLIVDSNGELQVWMRDGSVWTDARNVYGDVSAKVLK